MIGHKKSLGKLGEDMAAKYLMDLQYQVIKRNYQCKFGEIDLIVYKDNTYVFVEVKTRKTLDFGRPIEAIDHKKVIHLKKVGERFIQQCRKQNVDFRFDAIEIMILPYKEPMVNHIKNIIF